MFSIADAFENVSQRIQKSTKSAGRVDGSVQLLPVSKTRSAETLKDAMGLGLKTFGENYVSEALDKQVALRALCSEAEYEEIVWHFIGPIQSNKTKAIVENFDWVQSIDRTKIVKRLNDQRPEHLEPVNVCIQINIDEEDSKAGILLPDLESMAALVDDLPKICLRGLMCIPKANQSEDSLANAFIRMQQAFKQLQASYPSVDTLSMGMSGDIECAIKNGANMVRVGTALFGPRQIKNAET